MKKIAIFAFQDDPMCFIHVLLNALDLKERGIEARVILEGKATALIPLLAAEDHPLHRLWNRVKESGLVDGVCKACSSRMKTLEAAIAQELRLLDEMAGHPSMGRYREDGFDIVTF
ncbi:MAG: cytoplasmic protein [Syntrophaceae bacterium]|nr:cytoplasmic protein [Syntrophaceae bacterium]